MDAAYFRITSVIRTEIVIATVKFYVYTTILRITSAYITQVCIVTIVIRYRGEHTTLIYLTGVNGTLIIVIAFNKGMLASTG